jgi:hypothetical protein
MYCIWGSHSSVDVDGDLPGCDAMWTCRWPWRWRQYVHLQCRYRHKSLHGITTQKTTIDMLCIVHSCWVYEWDLYFEEFPSPPSTYYPHAVWHKVSFMKQDAGKKDSWCPLGRKLGKPQSWSILFGKEKNHSCVVHCHFTVWAVLALCNSIACQNKQTKMEWMENIVLPATLYGAGVTQSV